MLRVQLGNKMLTFLSQNHPLTMDCRLLLATSLVSTLLFSSCKKDESTSAEPMLVVRISVDSTQERLGNTGAPNPMPAGHAGQHPLFNKISAHYLELAPSALTLLGQGAIVYHAPETQAGGDTAIDFQKATVVKPGEVFLKVPIRNITPGSYEWVRLSVSYQNYDIRFRYAGNEYSSTLASFVGYNNYITSFKVKNQTVNVNASKKQGFWAFETPFNVVSGQSPPGATTVPNPLFNTSPIPQGSCVVTGRFIDNLVITGDEQTDVSITLSLSTNNSFEWIDTNGNGAWDVDTSGVEQVVDMGLRGLVPKKL